MYLNLVDEPSFPSRIRPLIDFNDVEKEPPLTIDQVETFEAKLAVFRKGVLAEHQKEVSELIRIPPEATMNTLKAQGCALHNVVVTSCEVAYVGRYAWNVKPNGDDTFKPTHITLFEAVNFYPGEIGPDDTVEGRKSKITGIVIEASENTLTFVEARPTKQSYSQRGHRATMREDVPRIGSVVWSPFLPDKNPTNFVDEMKRWAYGASNPPHTKLLRLGFKLDIHSDATEKKTIYSQKRCQGHAALKLNPSQRAAVVGALSGDLTQQPIHLIHGPPGTGKTTTLGSLLQEVAMYSESKVICVAPTHKAIDKLLSAALESGVPRLIITRLGHPAKIDCNHHEITLDARIMKEVGRELQLISDEIQTLGSMVMDGPMSHKKKNALHKEYQTLWNQTAHKYIATSRLIFCTPCAANQKIVRDVIENVKSEPHFDFVVVDEASQLASVDSWKALRWAKRAILCGDPYQLGPVIVSDEAEKMGLGDTIMGALLTDANERTPCYLLSIQYRMNCDIVRWSNRSFYNNKIETPDTIAARRLTCSKLGENHGFLVINTEDDPSARENSFGKGADGSSVVAGEFVNPRSASNRGEAQIVKRTVNRLFSDGVTPDQIKIICPYKRQRAILGALFSGSGVEVGTIDSFQGREADVIIISMTRSNPSHSVGFLRNPHRLNVAFTRARLLCILVGDAKTISSDPTIADILESANGNVLPSDQI